MGRGGVVALPDAQSRVASRRCNSATPYCTCSRMEFSTPRYNPEIACSCTRQTPPYSTHTIGADGNGYCAFSVVRESGLEAEPAAPSSTSRNTTTELWTKRRQTKNRFTRKKYNTCEPSYYRSQSFSMQFQLPNRASCKAAELEIRESLQQLGLGGNVFGIPHLHQY